MKQIGYFFLLGTISCYGMQPGAAGNNPQNQQHNNQVWQVQETLTEYRNEMDNSVLWSLGSSAASILGFILSDKMVSGDVCMKEWQNYNLF